MYFYNIQEKNKQTEELILLNKLGWSSPNNSLEISNKTSLTLLQSIHQSNNRQIIAHSDIAIEGMSFYRCIWLKTNNCLMCCALNLTTCKTFSHHLDLRTKPEFCMNVFDVTFSKALNWTTSTSSRSRICCYWLPIASGMHFHCV